MAEYSNKIPTKKRSSIPSTEIPPSPEDLDSKKDAHIAAFRLWSMRYDTRDDDELITPGDYAAAAAREEEAAKIKKRKFTHHHRETDLLLPQPLKQYFKKCENSGNDTLVSLERNLPPYPPIEILKGCIGECSKPFSKKITKTDVADSHCRLMIKKEQVEESLTPLLRGRERLTKDGIDVISYDPQGKEWPMKLKQWAEGKFVVLNGVNWKWFCRDQGMSPYEEEREWLIDIWSFRHLKTGQLSFAIIPSFAIKGSTSTGSSGQC